jgi:hypothetical protein
MYLIVRFINEHENYTWNGVLLENLIVIHLVKTFCVLTKPEVSIMYPQELTTFSYPQPF